MNLKATAGVGAHEPILHCPNCNHQIHLTESLAAPLIEETRRRFQEQLANKDAEIARRTEAIRQEREELAKQREQIGDQVARQLAAERSQLVATEANKRNAFRARLLISKPRRGRKPMKPPGCASWRGTRPSNQWHGRSRS
jgi:uncharacterized membrane protein YccC